MKLGRLKIAGLLLGSAMALTGCGGGGDFGAAVTIPVVIPVVVPVGPTFDIWAYLNGLKINGFHALPGDVQTLTVPIGQSFELTSDSPVSWTVFVNGVQVPSVNNTIAVGDVTITETTTTNVQFSGYATSPTYLPAPVQVTLIATSLVDNSPSAQINFVITN